MSSIIIPVCKIVVAGDGGVGKTTLIYKLIGSEHIITMTPGISIESMKVEISSECSVDVVFWDMGGQPQFRFFQQNFFECANVVILVFDLTRYKSFLNLKNEWIKMIQTVGILTSSIVILVGNKLDLGQSISDEEIEAFANEYKMKFFKISAKEGTNLDALEKHLREAIEACYS